MAIFMNNGVVLTVDGVDLSDFVTSVTLNQSFDELEVTAMGDSGHRYVKGLESGSITIDFLNDTSSVGVLKTLGDNWGDNVVVTAKNQTGTTTAENPLYTMTVLINNLTPINGAVGDISTQSVTFNVSGSIVRTTA